MKIDAAEDQARAKQELIGLIPFVNTFRQASRIGAAYDKGSFAGGMQVGRTTFSAAGDAAIVYGAVKGGQARMAPEPMPSIVPEGGWNTEPAPVFSDQPPPQFD